MTIDHAAQNAQRRHLPRRKMRLPLFPIFYSLALLAFLFMALSQGLNAIHDHPSELLLCFVIGCLSIYGQLLSLQRDASIHFASFVFCFLFLSVAPMIQLGAYADPIFGIDRWAFWAVVNSLAFTSIGVLITYRMKKPRDERLAEPIVAPSGLNYLYVCLVTAITSTVALALYRGALFTSRDEFADVTGQMFGDPNIGLIVKTLLTCVPVFGAVLGLRSARAEKRWWWVLIFSLLAVIAAVINNPLVHPRYQLASLAIFAVDYFFYGRRTKLLAVMLAVGVFVAPVLQAFRYSTADAGSISESNQPFGETFLSMDYDAFQMSCYTMITVNDGGIAWGGNLLGAALFFVPRSWWPSKPEPTAWVIYDTVSHTRNPGTVNLSTPLMAEGYYAFGWVGALLISLAYWWGISKVIIISWKNSRFWAFLCRCLFAGLALIFLRGTLTVGVSAFAGFFLAAAIPGYLINHRFKLTGRY